MHSDIEERTINIAQYIIETKATVRNAAKKFGVSKSTVHKDVAERLWVVDKSLAKAVGEVLSKNKADRHLRGGMATKHKYERMKSGAKNKI